VQSSAPKPGDRLIVVLPMFPANAQYYSFAPAICVGASVALMYTFSASGFVRQAAAHQATHASLFAAPIRMILARSEPAGVGGQLVRMGERVTLWMISANYDEVVFADPSRLDLTRSPNPHVKIGGGPHFCIGAYLARKEITTAYEALWPRHRQRSDRDE
jgi:hypothetical protein